MSQVFRCWCYDCNLNFTDPVSGLPAVMSRMILCPTCGNKRCPHASDHRHACTNSNEPGQPGSRYTVPTGRFQTMNCEHCKLPRDAWHDCMQSLMAEVERLRALITQAPIAKVTVREGCAHYAPDDVSASLYAPGLPPGEYDLYLMPDVPQSEQRSTTEESK